MYNNNNNAIKRATECVRWIKNNGEICYGKTRLNYGRGEQAGNTPLEYSIIFKVGDQYFHFFTSDMRWCDSMTVRTCDGERDFHGGSNYTIDNADELRQFVGRKVAGKGVVYA